MTEAHWHRLVGLARQPYTAVALAGGSTQTTLDTGRPDPLLDVLRSGDLDRLSDLLSDSAPGDPTTELAAADPRPDEGCLMIVGVGLRLGGHLTAESEAAIRQADRVVYLVTDPATSAWVRSLNPNARSLWSLYEVGKDRQEIYAEMVTEIAQATRAGQRTCFVIYGHPGVLVQASHRVTAAVRERGLPVVMLPGVSAEACLVADLGYDTGQGLQSYEATEFLIYRRTLDPRVAAVIWQPGVVGHTTHVSSADPGKLQILSTRLTEIYGGDHPAIIYEAAYVAGVRPLILQVTLADLAAAVTLNSTLFIPPRDASAVDGEMAASLGIHPKTQQRPPFRPNLAPGASR